MRDKKEGFIYKITRLKPYILLLFGAAFFLISCHPFWSAAVITLCIFFSLQEWKVLDILITEKLKKLPRPASILIAIGICFCACLQIKANIPTLTLNQNFIKTVNHQTISNNLEKIFEKYNTKNFEEIPELSEPACHLENRFTLILVNIIKIEETDNNIKQRNKNLKQRRKKLISNIDKIQQRERKAKIEISEINNIPKIETQQVSFTHSYRRISLWAKEIDKNMSQHKCSLKCIFNHIDVASINIINEISDIQKTQDVSNQQLSELERTFNKLEKVQQYREFYLTQKGF